jgi:hypothetical protein
MQNFRWEILKGKFLDIKGVNRGIILWYVMIENNRGTMSKINLETKRYDRVKWFCVVRIGNRFGSSVNKNVDHRFLLNSGNVLINQLQFFINGLWSVNLIRLLIILEGLYTQCHNMDSITYILGYVRLRKFSDHNICSCHSRMLLLSRALCVN